ncbi:uncharacterized protein [Miscanthus floridulus]|uniref:uncharacterized protein n=1 Tax=Miscanthus floridulus TaxID=154761 RepID=UPI003457BCF9
MTSANLQGLGADAAIGAPDVEPLPSIFGPGADASSSKDEDAGVGDFTMSSSTDAASMGRTQSVKASRLEESEVESDDRVHPIGSPRPMDTDVADATKGILSFAAGSSDTLSGWAEALGQLQVTKKDFDEMKAKAESLDKALAGSKAAEDLALERPWKATKITNNLRKEQLDEAKTLVLAAAEAYTTALAGFGGVTSSLLAEALASGLFTWMSTNFAKLPNFAGKVADFAALSSATNLATALAEGGYEHVEVLKRKKDYKDPTGLGEIPKPISSADLTAAEAARAVRDTEALKARKEAAGESSRAAEARRREEPASKCTPPEVASRGPV